MEDKEEKQPTLKRSNNQPFIITSCVFTDMAVYRPHSLDLASFGYVDEQHSLYSNVIVLKLEFDYQIYGLEINV
jgi:hypothetical protein